VVVKKKIDLREIGPGEIRAALSFLEEDPVGNLHLIWPLRRWGLFNLGLPEQGRLLGAFFRKSMRGLLFRGNLGVWRLCAGGDTAVALAEKALSLWGMPEVLAGPEDDVEALLEEVEALRKAVEHRERELSLLLCAGDFRPRRGAAVRGKPDDLDDLVALEEMMQLELLGSRSRRAVIASQMLRAIEESAALVRCDGLAVAKAEIEATTPQVDELGGVYTLPSHRRRGYAGSACTLVCAESLSRGRKVRLETQRENRAALELYRGLGFRELWPHLAVRFAGAGPRGPAAPCSQSRKKNI
jgi:ribosomal protein S18 acetylase RimI-like enzyme